ncbi:MAG: hypothetical protein ACLRM8_00980 [Alistipes sp.]
MTFAGCTKVDDTLGSNLVPDNQQMKVGYTTLGARTLAGNSMRPNTSRRVCSRATRSRRPTSPTATWADAQRHVRTPHGGIPDPVPQRLQG